jgi:predicted nucleic acid-binding protein
VIFLDTNIWFYGYVYEQPKKQRRAADLVEEPNVILSSQIVNELISNLLRKRLMKENDLRDLIDELYTDYLVLEIQKDDIQTASELREQYRFAYWDSLIVATALLPFYSPLPLGRGRGRAPRTCSTAS